MENSIFFDSKLYFAEQDIQWESTLPVFFQPEDLNILPPSIMEPVLLSFSTKVTPPDEVLELLSDKNKDVIMEAALVAPQPVSVRVFIEDDAIVNVFLK